MTTIDYSPCVWHTGVRKALFTLADKAACGCPLTIAL